MRIAVIGVGGIGAWYVARFVEAGHEVTAVARGAHLQALRAQGLRLMHETQAFAGPVDACDIDELVGRDAGAFELLVLLTKATATQEIGARLATWGDGHGPPLLSLQNGVDNETMLVDALGTERVIGGYSVLLSGHVEAPGEVHCVGGSNTWLGVWPDDKSGPPGMREQVQAIAEVLQASGLLPHVASDIRREMWRKLVLNNGVNPLSALTGRDTRRLSHEADTAWLVRALMDEAVAAGAADGVALGATDADDMLQLIRGFPPVKTSMLVDLERGKPLELDAIAGAVLRRGQQHGVELPYTRTVAALLEARLAE